MSGTHRTGSDDGNDGTDGNTVMSADERIARDQAKRICQQLRGRGDSLSLDAAAEIEGTLDAFAAIAEQTSELRRKLMEAEQKMEDGRRYHIRMQRVIASVPRHIWSEAERKEQERQAQPDRPPTRHRKKG